ncbi:hypothetical protein CMO88_02320 [Candidatus Woesearchaeota archaeon]|nr:hypothetical protein [Candidatus Woesearchaeota archaeon]
MKRVLIDTNVYGELILDEVATNMLVDLIPSELIIYGSEINRTELRDVAKQAKLDHRSKRISLLNLYDFLTQKEKRTYRTTPFIELLSLKYFEEYTRLKGKKGYELLRKDFIIVATATIHNMDLVVSKDTKTMLSKEAKKAYENLNQRNQLRIPELLDYADFKKELERLYNEERTT